MEWRARVKRTEPEALMFATWSGKPISANNVVRQWIVPACATLGLKRVTWLTLRRTYSSWAHEKGVPGKVIAQLMGHAKVDTTLNVYTQVLDGSLRRAADTVGSELFTIVHKPEKTMLGHPPKAGRPSEARARETESQTREDPIGFGSSGWTRTSNPPVNRMKQVGYLVDTSCL
jgi:integrase-like protein